MSRHTTTDGRVIEITKEVDMTLSDFEFIMFHGEEQLFGRVDGKIKLIHKNIYKIVKEE